MLLGGVGDGAVDDDAGENRNDVLSAFYISFMYKHYELQVA